jgi:plastocyanin
MKKFSLFILSLLFSQAVLATQHVITFGGNSYTGYSYSPDNIQVNVGDSIVWEGNFSTFPLASLVVPEGANSFNNNYGSVYIYLVTVQGEYNYECPTYFTQGMTGKFSAVNVATSTLALNTNAKPFYIVQEQGQNVLYSNFNSKVASDVILNIYDETGRMLAGATIDPYSSRYVLPQLPSGIYIVRLADNEKVLLATKVWQP